MPAPPNERQALEQELAELPVQIAVYLRRMRVNVPSCGEVQKTKYSTPAERDGCREAGVLRPSEPTSRT
jgi:hypothetical protein